MNNAQRDIRRKKRVLEHAARIGNVRKTYRSFGVARSGFYVWKKAYETQGDEGLVNLWVANYYSARNPLRLSSLVILGVVARMFRCATRSSCWCT